MSKVYREVARVKALYRYPVKSMAGEPVEEVKVGWHGFAGDRRYAFVRLDDKTGLPWLSAREAPQLILYQPCFLDANAADNGSILVTTPTGREMALQSVELKEEIAQIYGGTIELLHVWRGTFDSMALSLISSSAIQGLSDLVGQSLEPERFRPNVLVEALDERPFPEDRWIDELVVFGERSDSARIRLNRKDPRCQIIDLDPRTAQRNPHVLETVVKTRKNLLGIYGSIERTGTIRVGDVVRLLLT